MAEAAIVHEHEAPMREGMAVRPRRRRRGRGPHMGEEKMRMDMPAEVLEILVGPGRPHLAIEPRLVVPGIPAEAEAVALRRAERLFGIDALAHERMLGCGHIAFEGDGAALVGD